MSGDYIVAIFPSRRVLTSALDLIAESDYIDIKRAVIVAKARSGETVILNDSISADEGGIAGGTLGAAISMLGLMQLSALALPGVGPVIALSAGALVGGLVGRLTGRFAAGFLEPGVHNLPVEMLAHQLQAGHPALLIQVENAALVLAKLRDDLKPFRAEVVEALRERLGVGVGR